MNKHMLGVQPPKVINEAFKLYNSLFLGSPALFTVQYVLLELCVSVHISLFIGSSALFAAVQ